MAQQTRTGRQPFRRFMIGKTARDFWAHDCLDRSAALTLFAVLAIPPLAIALTSVLAIIGQGSTSTETLLDVVDVLAPDDDALAVISDPVRTVLEQPAAGWRLAFGVLVALWIAAGYVSSFGRAMNTIYGVSEGRPAWKLLGSNLLTTVALVVFAAVVTLFVVLSGPVARAVGTVLGLGDAAVTTWELARGPVLLLAAVVIVALLYRTTPNVRHQHFRLVSAGSLLALAVAIAGSFAFQLYIGLVGRFETTYGAAMAGIVVFVLWLWLINIALLLGAELDRELTRARQLARGMPADRAVQVTVRDERATERTKTRRRSDEARARHLRKSWNDGPE